MKFSIRPSLLASALSLVSRATSAKSTLPVLSNVLLKVADNKLSLSTTNLEIALTHTIDVNDAKDGAITVPVKLLTDYVSLVSGDEIKAELEDGSTLHLEAKGSKTDIKGIASDEFPLLPEVEASAVFQMPVITLIEAISQTAFASAITDTRPVLAGVYFDLNEDKLKIVATDSYRLAEKTISLMDSSPAAKFIVPARTISELGRVLPRYEDVIKVHVAKNQVLFELPDLHLVSRLIEGQYPPYDQIIPSEWQTRMKISTTDLLTVTRRSSLFVRESVNSIKFMFDPKKGSIQLVALSEQVGGETANLEAEMEGDQVEIAFNGQYVIDALANMGSSEVYFELQNPERPGVLKPVDGDDYLHVIMPLKL